MMKRRALLLLVCVALVLAAGATSVPANETFDAIATAWFESHNSGDEATIRAFIVKYRTAAALEKRPVDARVQRRMGMFGQVGPIEPREEVRRTETSLAYRAFAPKVGMWIEVAFAFEVGDEVKLDEVAIRPTQPPADEQPPLEWETVQELLDQVVEQDRIPAIAAAQVEGDEVVNAAVAGVRALGSDDAVETGDLWHIGSVTKSVTATMVAALVQAGTLHWETTLGDALGDIDMRDEYRGVTLADLMHHRGGIQPYTNETEEDEVRLAKLAGTPTEIRAGFAAEVLGREPVGPVGGYEYSNAGYTLAALMAERVTGQTWEDLVREHVFKAAGLESAGFGWPATPERPDQPRGHFLEGGDLRVQGLDEYDLGAYIAPAGDVHMSIEDLARYARFHLRGLKDGAGELNAESFRWLHTPGEGSGALKYAAGWIIMTNPTLGTAHWHNGSAGTFYTFVVLYPEHDRAVVVATNGSLGRGQAAAERVAAQINERWAENKK